MKFLASKCISYIHQYLYFYVSLSWTFSLQQHQILYTIHRLNTVHKCNAVQICYCTEYVCYM